MSYYVKRFSEEPTITMIIITIRLSLPKYTFTYCSSVHIKVPWGLCDWVLKDPEAPWKCQRRWTATCRKVSRNKTVGTCRCHSRPWRSIWDSVQPCLCSPHVETFPWEVKMSSTSTCPLHKSSFLWDALFNAVWLDFPRVSHGAVKEEEEDEEEEKKNKNLSEGLPALSPLP